MLFSISLALKIILPLVFAQYILVIPCLLKLVFLNLPKKKFFVWNFIMLLVPYAGMLAFLFCLVFLKKKVFSPAPDTTKPTDKEKEKTVEEEAEEEK